MPCPHCGFENINATAFCEQCGAPQNTVAITLKQEEYKAPPPPPLNGHTKPPVPSLTTTHPSFEHDQGAFPPYSYAQSIIGPATRIFSAILYFIGILIAIFGLLGILTTFGSGNTIGLIGLLLSLIIVIISIVFLFRKRTLNLRWWQRIVWIVVATLVAFLALTLEVIAYPGGTLTNYFTGTIILLYGLCCAAIAIW